MTCSTRVTLTTALTSPMRAPAISPLALSPAGGGKSSVPPFSSPSHTHGVSAEYSCEFESAGYLIAEAEAAAARRGLHGTNPPPGTLITSNNPKVSETSPLEPSALCIDPILISPRAVLPHILTLKNDPLIGRISCIVLLYAGDGLEYGCAKEQGLRVRAAGQGRRRCCRHSFPFPSRREHGGTRTRAAGGCPLPPATHPHHPRAPPPTTLVSVRPSSTNLHPSQRCCCHRCVGHQRRLQLSSRRRVRVLGQSHQGDLSSFWFILIVC